MSSEEVAAALAKLPDDARVSIMVGSGDLRIKDLRGAFAGQDPNRVITTRQASEALGYSAASWRNWAQDGKIAGAYRDDGEGTRWRLPYTSCVEYLEKLRGTPKRRRRKPWGRRQHDGA